MKIRWSTWIANGDFLLYTYANFDGIRVSIRRSALENPAIARDVLERYLAGKEIPQSFRSSITDPRTSISDQFDKKARSRVRRVAKWIRGWFPTWIVFDETRRADGILERTEIRNWPRAFRVRIFVGQRWVLIYQDKRPPQKFSSHAPRIPKQPECP